MYFQCSCIFLIIVIFYRNHRIRFFYFCKTQFISKLFLQHLHSALHRTERIYDKMKKTKQKKTIVKNLTLIRSSCNKAPATSRVHVYDLIYTHSLLKGYPARRDSRCSAFFRSKNPNGPVSFIKQVLSPHPWYRDLRQSTSYTSVAKDQI